LDVFIESIDRQSCYHLRNDRSNVVPTVNCPHVSVDDFVFDGKFDWTCDGTGLIATGHRDDTGDWGIHLIAGILDSAGDFDGNITITPLRTVDDPFDHAEQPASRHSCSTSP
jgi:hypothetical protein